MKYAGGLFSLTLGLCIAGSVLAAGDVGAVTVSVWLIALSAVGALVASKQSRNPVGWLLLGTALSLAAGVFVTSLARFAVENDLSAGIPRWAGWMSLWIGTPAAATFVLALLYFPNGKLLSPLWRVPAVVAVVASACMTLGYAVKPGTIDNLPTVENPVQVGASALLYELANDMFSMLLGASGLFALVSLVIRMRGSQGLERQQLKWFVYSVAVFPVLYGIALATDAVLDAQLGPGEHYVDFFILMFGVVLIPISMGVSILRYRLYEIDVIINKTLVYAALTAILAGVYLGIVVVLQQVVATVATDSDLAIAASTLVVAALFRPLRSRVQAFIDQRFYRRKYDAAATLQRFAGRLRDEVDLDSLSRELVTVVGSTMQPTHASLWLRLPEERAS